MSSSHEISTLKTMLIDALAIAGDISFDGDLQFTAPPFEATTQASVLVLVNGYNQTITLTKRQSNMRKHAGQIAFAGGRRDKSDASLWHTALREANEEIGLPIEHPVENLGTLPQHMTITKFAVTPFIAFNPKPFEYIAQEAEVAEIFELPFLELKIDNFQTESHEKNGQKRSFYVLPYKDYYIWGATARILHNLAGRLAHAHNT